MRKYDVLTIKQAPYCLCSNKLKVIANLENIEPYTNYLAKEIYSLFRKHKLLKDPSSYPSFTAEFKGAYYSA